MQVKQNERQNKIQVKFLITHRFCGLQNLRQYREQTFFQGQRLG